MLRYTYLIKVPAYLKVLFCYGARTFTGMAGLTDSVNTTHGLGKDVVLCSAPPNGSKDTQHSTWRIKIGEAFQWGSGGREAEACTPPGLLLRSL
jgi:hypothetical protein